MTNACHVQRLYYVGRDRDGLGGMSLDDVRGGPLEKVTPKWTAEGETGTCRRRTGHWGSRDEDIAAGGQSGEAGESRGAGVTRPRGLSDQEASALL